MRAAMQNVADEDIPRIDTRVRERWARLCWTLGPEAADEGFEPVAVHVSRTHVRATFRRHTAEVRLKASAAKVYSRMDYSMFVTHFDDCLRAVARSLAQKLAAHACAEPIVLVPTIAFAHPLDAWLPTETVRHAADLARIARILEISE